MRKLVKELEHRKIIEEKLLEYGFIKIEDSYRYERELPVAGFKVIYEVENGAMSSKVIDTNTSEEYTLIDVPSSTGEFVGKIRESYDDVLHDIISNCTISDVFKSEYAKKIIDYVKEKYDDNLEFLWQKFENNAIWRNKKNDKWYGALLVIEENKLDIDSDKEIEIIDLRYQKEDIEKIIDNKTIFRGYHMNKNNWITVKLDGSVKLDKILELIDNSYDISLTK